MQAMLTWVQGMMALGCLRPAALGVHVIVGTMFAAALGAHNVAEYNQLEDRYALARERAFPCFLFSGKPNLIMPLQRIRFPAPTCITR